MRVGLGFGCITGMRYLCSSLPHVLDALLLLCTAESVPVFRISVVSTFVQDAPRSSAFRSFRATPRAIKARRGDLYLMGSMKDGNLQQLSLPLCQHAPIGGFD